MSKITNLTQFIEEQVFNKENVHTPFVVREKIVTKDGREVEEVFIEKASRMERLHFAASKEARGLANMKLAQTLAEWRRQESAESSSNPDYKGWAKLGVQYLTFDRLKGMGDEKKLNWTVRDRLLRLTGIPETETLNNEQLERLHKIELMIHAVQKGWDKKLPSPNDLAHGSNSNLSTASGISNWGHAVQENKPHLGFVIRSASDMTSATREAIRAVNITVNPETGLVNVTNIEESEKWTDVRNEQLSEIVHNEKRRAKDDPYKKNFKYFSRSVLQEAEKHVEEHQQAWGEYPVDKSHERIQSRAQAFMAENADVPVPSALAKARRSASSDETNEGQLRIVGHYADPATLVFEKKEKYPVQEIKVKAEVHPVINGEEPVVYASVVQGEVAKEKRPRSIPVAPPTIPPVKAPVAPLPEDKAPLVKINVSNGHYSVTCTGHNVQKFVSKPTIVGVEHPTKEGAWQYIITAKGHQTIRLDLPEGHVLPKTVRQLKETDPDYLQYFSKDGTLKSSNPTPFGDLQRQRASLAEASSNPVVEPSSEKPIAPPRKKHAVIVDGETGLATVKRH